MRHTYISTMLLAAALLSSCDSFLDIAPVGKIIAKTGDEYRQMLTYEYHNFPEDRGLMTLRGDEMTLSPAATSAEDYDSYFDLWRWNDDAPNPATASPNWRRYWHVVYIANYVIGHQGEITGVSAADREQMAGEAYMLRAYCHFLLANIFAEPYAKTDPAAARGVPIQLVADVNAIPACSSLEAVYAQVLADIAEAQKLLNVEAWPIGANYRFSSMAAEALKARVLLYKGDWRGALEAAGNVIAKHGELEDLNAEDSRLPNEYDSKENILALEEVMTNAYKNVGRPSAWLYDMYRPGDMRRTRYYKRVTTTNTALQKGGSNRFACSVRSAEMYLIAAEAAARLGDDSSAKGHLTALARHRLNASALENYLEALAALSGGSLIAEIIDERARELAFEGFRWDDLRRTSQPALSKAYKGETFTLADGDPRYTLRFPAEAVEANPGLEVWPAR